MLFGVMESAARESDEAVVEMKRCRLEGRSLGRGSSLAKFAKFDLGRDYVRLPHASPLALRFCL